jgi:hypothetical protein
MCIWKIVARVLQSCVYICGALWVILSGSVFFAPNKPDLASGNVVPVHWHGGVVYITSARAVLLDWILPCLVVFGLCASAARRMAKERKSS